MKLVWNWFVVLFGLVGAVLLVHHLGFDAGSAIAASLHDLESALNRPL